MSMLDHWWKQRCSQGWELWLSDWFPGHTGVILKNLLHTCFLTASLKGCKIVSCSSEAMILSDLLPSFCWTWFLICLFFEPHTGFCLLLVLQEAVVQYDAERDNSLPRDKISNLGQLRGWAFSVLKLKQLELVKSVGPEVAVLLLQVLLLLEFSREK